MGYTATITSNNQITLPKHIREVIGVKSGESVVFRVRKDAVTLEREKTAEEIAAEIRALIPEEVRQSYIKRNAGRTAGQFREDWLKSNEAQEYYAERLRGSMEDE